MYPQIRYTPPYETVKFKYCMIYVYSENPFEIVKMVNFSDEVNAEIQIYPPCKTVSHSRSSIG